MYNNLTVVLIGYKQNRQLLVESLNLMLLINENAESDYLLILQSVNVYLGKILNR